MRESSPSTTMAETTMKEAGDGIFSRPRECRLRPISDIDRNTQRIEQFIKQDTRALNQPVFQNRQLVDTAPIQLLHLGSDGLHVRFPLVGLSNAVTSDQSLIITDGSVVRDPARTYNGCITGCLGKRTFG